MKSAFKLLLLIPIFLLSCNQQSSQRNTQQAIQRNDLLIQNVRKDSLLWVEAKDAARLLQAKRLVNCYNECNTNYRNSCYRDSIIVLLERVGKNVNNGAISEILREVREEKWKSSIVIRQYDDLTQEEKELFDKSMNEAKEQLKRELEAEQSFRPKVKIGYDQYDCKRVMGTPHTIDSHESQYGTTERWIYRDELNTILTFDGLTLESIYITKVINTNSGGYIRTNNLSIGWSKNQCRQELGSPHKKTLLVSKYSETEEWFYNDNDRTLLRFNNGRLESISTRKNYD